MATVLSYSEEEGLALLGQQSPAYNHPDAGQFRVEGTQLLDYDSDGSQRGPESSLQRAATATAQIAAMDTESGENDNVTADVIPTMDSVYYQCRSARLATQKDTLISVSNDESYGKKAIVQSPSIGSLENSSNIETTFHGSRVMKGNTTVNESISASFDPGKLICISCGKDHNVIGKNPTVILFSDQNFTATLDCSNGGCIHIVRMENATLLELLGIAKEIFGDVVFPEGAS
jgi:hypothetical protein